MPLTDWPIGLPGHDGKALHPEQDHLDWRLLSGDRWMRWFESFDASLSELCLIQTEARHSRFQCWIALCFLHWHSGSSQTSNHHFPSFSGCDRSLLMNFRVPVYLQPIAEIFTDSHTWSLIVPFFHISCHIQFWLMVIQTHSELWFQLSRCDSHFYVFHWHEISTYVIPNMPTTYSWMQNPRHPGKFPQCVFYLYKEPLLKAFVTVSVMCLPKEDFWSGCDLSGYQKRLFIQIKKDRGNFLGVPRVLHSAVNMPQEITCNYINFISWICSVSSKFHRPERKIYYHGNSKAKHRCDTVWHRWQLSAEELSCISDNSFDFA
jgi:hypothetical protein